VELIVDNTSPEPVPVETLIPLADRVLVRRLEYEQREDSKIIVPEIARVPSTECIVEAIGPGRIFERNGVRVPVDVKVGDRVVIGKYSGADIENGEKQYLLVKEDEIMCVLEPEDEP